MRPSSISRSTLSAAMLAAVLLLAAGRVSANDSAESGRIAIVGNQSGSFQLYTMNPDGTHMVQITSLDSTTFESWLPDFSPSGRQLTFSYGVIDSLGNGSVEIYKINVDGTALTQLTYDGMFDWAPRWSPDGTHILFLRTAADGSTGLSTIRADGSHERGITNSCPGPVQSGYTEDGSHILFDSPQGGFVSAIWIMNADGTHQVRLTQPPLMAGAPTAPSHGHVVFVNHVNNPLPNALFKMNLDGTNIVQLTQPAGDSHDVSPNLSPDGSHIVFASDRMSSDGSLDVFTMKIDGSDIKRIATGITVGGCPDHGCVTPAWGRKP